MSCEALKRHLSVHLHTSLWGCSNLILQDLVKPGLSSDVVTCLNVTEYGSRFCMNLNVVQLVCVAVSS